MGNTPSHSPSQAPSRTLSHTPSRQRPLSLIQSDSPPPYSIYGGDTTLSPSRRPSRLSVSSQRYHGLQPASPVDTLEDSSPTNLYRSSTRQSQNSQTTTTRRANRNNSVSLSDREDQLELLRKFDTVIVVDDSSSMEGALWFEAKYALAGIAALAARYDTNGIDLYFLNSRVTGTNLRSAAEVERIFDSVHPEGITPTGEKLEELLLDYLSKYEGAEPKPKPVSFLVLTDGAPSDDPLSVIVTAARRLDAQHAPLSQVGIQFVQLGADPRATEALRELDNDLSVEYNVRDMVDTTLYTGQAMNPDLLGKILLGGINRRVDRITWDN